MRHIFSILRVLFFYNAALCFPYDKNPLWRITKENVLCDMTPKMDDNPYLRDDAPFDEFHELLWM